MYMYAEIAVRLLAAVICSALIGFEREKRFKNAGIRTHIMVALASAVMMLISKYGFFDVIPYDSISLDPSRIAAGVVSAIGFLGAGVIILRGDAAALGLTTAAGLWATVGIGMAIGAGMYFLGILSTVLILIIQSVLHIRRLRIMSEAAGKVVINLTDSGLSISQAKERLSSKGITAHGAVIKRGSDGKLRLTAQVVFSMRRSEAALDALKEDPYIEELTLFTLF